MPLNRKFHPVQILIFIIFMIAVFVYLLNSKTAFPAPFEPAFIGFSLMEAVGECCPEVPV